MAIELFHIIDDAQIILRSRGVFRQVKAFRRGDELFAGHGSGFIALFAKGGTSVPTISWVDISVVFVEAPIGRLKLKKP